MKEIFTDLYKKVARIFPEQEKEDENPKMLPATG